ncbi:hypothetical protein BSIN_1755 [Burkholderia singularis]|uniref:Uncharacterized protein n=1 Tax=Burkholderia singularis TaxID=1503053 RepID=A0A238GZQ6_9BURK|nr:hypothetical protein BSIN_1755 [Burkholderia singularis]
MPGCVGRQQRRPALPHTGGTIMTASFHYLRPQPVPTGNAAPTMPNRPA